MNITGLGQCSLDYLSLVDKYPEVDTKKEVLEWHEQGGGPVATALVALSRLGMSCCFYGIAGDDDAGEKIRQSLIEEGVNISGLMTRRGSASQLAFIAVEEKTASRTIFWRRPSGMQLQPEELGHDFLRDSDFLLLDGLMMDASISAAKKARKLKIPVMLDAGSARPGMFELCQWCDYVVASKAFAEGLGWEPVPDILMRQRKKLGIKTLTVTQGAKGSITVSEDKLIRMPAFRVDIVDTTGAGDVFHAGYVFGLLKQWDLEKVLRFASAFAALKCTRIGGRSGIPSQKEVMDFIKNQSKIAVQQ